MLPLGVGILLPVGKGRPPPLAKMTHRMNGIDFLSLTRAFPHIPFILNQCSLVNSRYLGGMDLTFIEIQPITALFSAILALAGG